MLYTATHLVCFALLTSFVRATMTPSGVGGGSIPPTLTRNTVKTDFTTIFNSIIAAYNSSHKHPTRDLNERDTIPPPPLFQEVFGPIDAANNADGYMGFKSLPVYDVNACAQACNARGFDDTSGPCIFFNIWQAVVNGTATSVTCSMYNTMTDASTADNTGQGHLQVTLSRGYSRITNLQDGSFQDFTCIVTETNGCPAESSIFWTRVFVENYDFVLIDNFLARTGTASCLFFFNPPTPTSPAFGSTLTYTQPLNTIAGETYIISFFYTMNTIDPLPAIQDGPLFSVFWNNVDVFDVLQVGEATGTKASMFFNAVVQVTAIGNDVLFFKNGVSFPHNLFLDDIAVYQNFL